MKLQTILNLLNATIKASFLLNAKSKEGFQIQKYVL